MRWCWFSQTSRTCLMHCQPRHSQQSWDYKICVTGDGTSSRHAQHPEMASTKALTGCHALCQAGEAERLTALGFKLLLLLLLQEHPKPGECSSAHEAEIHQKAKITEAN